MTSTSPRPGRHDGTASVRISDESQRLLRLIAAYEGVSIREVLDGIVGMYAQAWQKRAKIRLDAPGSP